MIRIILIILTMNCYYYTILFMSNTTQDGGTKGGNDQGPVEGEVVEEGKDK